MVGAIDTGLDFYRQVLALRAYRQEILSADIANASTPGFKGVDLDFNQALAASLSGSQTAPSDSANPAGRVWLVDDPRQIQMDGDDESASLRQAVKYQASADVTLDGNSVDLTQEKLSAAENAVEYEAAVTFTTQAVNMMMVAIKGSGSSSSSSGT